MPDKVTMYTGDRYASSYLLKGRVQIRGFDVEFIKLGPGGVAQIFNDMVHQQAHDIVDMPLSNYLIARDLGKPLVAVPVFPTMFNPILGPMVNRQAGIRRPRDLEGRRVGVSGFAFNPAVWLRGILLHHYDVAPDRIAWVEGEPNSQSGVPYFRSHRFTIEKTEQNLVKLAEEGKIDALFMADGGIEPTDNLDRLFPDFFTEVRRYSRETGVFPVNSVLVIREAAVQAHPGLPRALVEAYREAGRLYHQEAQDSAFHMGLPVGQLRKAGLFPHSDGLTANRKALRQMVHYCYEQSLIRTLFEPEELFVQG